MWALKMQRVIGCRLEHGVIENGRWGRTVIWMQVFIMHGDMDGGVNAVSISQW